jgi:dsDNA-specific endonuclease/ATPase MutS2
MATRDTKKVQLNGEDRQRMQRLSEEVRARLTEMSLIFSRAMEVDFSEAVLKFTPEKVDGTDPQARRGKHIEIICAPDGTCGCWVDPPGICEYPCGAAGPL